VPEETAVFAIELAGAFITHIESCAGRIQTVDEHSSPRRLQAQLLLILQRTHGRQRAEMMVQRGWPHARKLREVVHAQRFRVVRSDPSNRSIRPLTLISLGCDASQPRT